MTRKRTVPDDQTTSLYRFYGAKDALLYIGITNSVPRRLGEHDEKKPWFIDAIKVTMEHYPSRLAALEAEKKAIKSERPKYNLVHNHGRAEKKVATTPGRWVFRSLQSGVEKRADLYLYPELDCSSMVDEVNYLDGEGQFEEYVQYLQRHHMDWLHADAVPIDWSVQGPAISQSAPFQEDERPWGDFLRHFTWPVDAKTGDYLDWYQLPVVNNRFPEFAEALAWTPSPMQPTCPFRSLLQSRWGAMGRQKADYAEAVQQYGHAGAAARF